jgi:DNA-binding SARP family transcriptional activator/predicted ATPase
MLRVHLLGRPRLMLDEIALSAGGRPKVVPLLAYLLLHRAGPLPRHTIANALWPDDAESDARANLRRHVNYLHHLLPPAPPDRPWLAAEPSTLGWNPQAELWFDVEAFETFAAQPARLVDALALYAGDLLADSGDEWLVAPRERLRERYHATLTAQVAALRAARNLPAAIAVAQQLLAADPWREDALRALVRSRYELGDRAGAVAEYERFAHTLREELGTEPMAESAAVYAAIRRDAGLDTGAAPPPSRAVGDAPPQLPFCGRVEQLAALRDRWTFAAGGAGGLMLIGGEAGVGKTRLVREFAAACEAGGALVYEAAAAFPEAVPYQPHAELVRAAAPLAATLHVDGVWLSALAALVPSIADHVAELPVLPAADPTRERLRLFEAYAHFWEAIAARRPVVLVVEDLHWAGAGTVALLEHVARRAQSNRILVVATYREDELELNHPLRATRRRLESGGAAGHVALDRLPVAAVEELVIALGRADDPAALAGALHARSEGNPFVLGEVLRDLDESGAVRVVGGRWIAGGPLAAAVPPAVRDALRSRLARLDERAAGLAEVAAVIGRTFDPELLREVTGWTEAVVLDALGTLVDRRLVGEHGVRGLGHAFTHHLIRAVIYDAIPPAARIRRHRRIARVMGALYRDQRDDIAAEIALHWDRGGEAESAAVEYVAAARRAQAVYANDEARAHLSRALELTASAPLRFAALLLREQIAAAAGDRDAQARDLEQLTAIARGLGDDDAICTVLERRIELMNVISDRRGERAALRLLQQRVRRSDDVRWRIRLLEAQARFGRVSGDFAGARDAVARLVALARTSGDRGAYVKARLALADSYIYEGKLDEASAALDELRAAVQLEDNQSAWVRTLMAFARASLAQQNYAAMTAYGREAHAISCAIGDREGEALALHTLANGSLTTFAMADARKAYAAALALYERIDHRVGIASISVDLGLFHTELGLFDAALELFARARRVAAEIGFGWVACVERVNASYCLRLRGEYAAARDAAADALRSARTIGSAPLESAALGTLGVAECALGDLAGAIEHLERGVALRRPSGSTPRLGDNLCGLARARLAAGDLAAAGVAAGELLALYDDNPKLPAQPTEWLWTIAQVERARDGAAGGLIRRAASVMQARAAAIDDPATRAAYLALPFNREVAEAAMLPA